ncbi:angiopoietin-related protein 1 [Drosophila subobscura]|uniref:angiopoietin-related protein 1 n=1 Tax=Drosophila subobscura TaxID=7241 RepID=UPI00155A9158|nr:angiopoietin-related protein 1 [Drosophila subobscura]
MQSLQVAGWTVIARHTNKFLSFYRDWEDSMEGFGDISGDFFIGLDMLHAITKSQNQELCIHLEDFEESTRYPQYDEFQIESENDLYRLTKLGSFRGDAGDAMTYSKNQKFTTYDNDNDGEARGHQVTRGVVAP